LVIAGNFLPLWQNFAQAAPKRLIILRKQISHAKRPVGVERRQVTVLFSDLVGSTALHLRDTPLRLLRAQCSPYHGNTVLYPIAESGVSALSDRTAPEIIDADRLSAALG
jgi:hypothetical protein